ncbi:MAG: uracil phosphoribosyltransferase [Clostridia bacterium]|nr:uracil phosphoribosyltransferase [Clostridia bacterium]
MNETSTKKKLLLDVNERPGIIKWIILAFQHVFAMFGATVLVPILVNQGIAAAGVPGEALSIAVALVTAGLGTLIYILCTKAKSPVFLGSSFAFITPIIAAYIAGASTGNPADGLAGAMTGIMVVGVVYIIVSLLIRIIGKKWIDKLLPPVVIGPMIMIIGLGLASSAVNSIGIGSGVESIDWKGVAVAAVTFLTTALIMVRAKGFFKIIPFLIGIVVGYILSVCLGLVDFTAVQEAAWFQVPKFNIPFVNYNPNFMIALTMAPIALVTMAEHIGDHTALSTIIGKDLLKKPGLENTLMGDGLATFVAGALGGPANTTYGENTSVVGMTKVASVWVIGLAAIFAIIFGFLGKFTALVQTIPSPVLGGISLLLYGFIAVNGLKVLIQNKTDFTKNKNIIVASCMLVLGLGGAVINFKTGGDMVVPLSGMSLAAIMGILLNLILPEEKEDNTADTEEKKDETKTNVVAESVGENSIKIKIEEINKVAEKAEEPEKKDEETTEEKEYEQITINEDARKEVKPDIVKKKFENVIEVNHPLVEHKLGILRSKNTGTKEFRELANEIGMFLCFKAMEDVELDETEVETPICKMKTGRLDEDKFAFIPILRAGMGILDGVINVIPNAKVGHIGMYRDDANNHKPVNYFFKVPKNIENKEAVILDPMLATGGSAIDAIELLKDKGVKKIKFICLIAAPEGLKAVTEKHPDVKIYCAHIDDKLNEDAYIVPGLGDAGDRIYGTK